ncbi:MAG: OmpA family protein [Deltaproteobacteria bacterium]|nr:OmpA family protein [Deltaproteobacteria bacterium]
MEKEEGRYRSESQGFSGYAPPFSEKIDDSVRNTEEEARDLEQEIKDEFKSIRDNLHVKAKDGDIRISLTGGSTFDSGSAEIKPETAPILEKIAGFLNQREGEVVIAGHTDNVPISNSIFKSNLELSVGRSAAVAQFFISRGSVDAGRIATMGFGEHRPIAANDTPDGRENNRRVEIVLTKLPDPSKLTRESQKDESNWNTSSPHAPPLQ